MVAAVQPEACTNTVLSNPGLKTLVPAITGPLSMQGKLPAEAVHTGHGQHT